MSKPFSVILKSTITILFACSAIPAFAQHGGGGGHAGGFGGGGGFHGGGGMGGGGFHGGGGGGFHGGGGGFHAGGGGFHGGGYGPPSAGYGAPHAGPSVPTMRPGGGYGGNGQRPGNGYSGYSRPGGSGAGGNQRFGSSAQAPPAAADGRWHSFSGEGGNRGPSGPPSQAGSSAGSGGYRVYGGSRGAASSGTGRSFSGEGHQIWENAPAARNVVPKSQSLSTIHDSFNASLGANSMSRSNSFLSTNSRNSNQSAIGRRGFSGGLNTANSSQAFSHNRIGTPFVRPRGCTNCGVGSGFGSGLGVNVFNGWGWNNSWRWGWGFGRGWGGWGWGWGWPWIGSWGWDPFWYDLWWGGPSYGYGYPAYPNYGVYNYPDSGYSAPNDNSAPPPQQDNQPNYNQDNQGESNGNWITPNGSSPSYSQNPGGITVPILIYMKNGSVYSVRDYWMVDGELHYIMINGVQKSVDLDLVDLQRTNTENAKSGVKFIFKSEPSVTPPAPDENTPPPATPNSIGPNAQPGTNETSPAPAPTKQLDAVPRPEART